jgi:hypothetical protein
MQITAPLLRKLGLDTGVNCQAMWQSKPNVKWRSADAIGLKTLAASNYSHFYLLFGNYGCGIKRSNILAKHKENVIDSS